MKNLTKMSHNILATLLMLAVIPACTTTSSVKRRSMKAPPRPSSFTQNGAYLIGKGDSLSINVIGHDAYSGVFAVGPDGTIAWTLGSIQAEGKTLKDLRAVLTEGLQPFIRKPQLLVRLEKHSSYRYYITGQVNQQGSYPMLGQMDLLQAIAEARGLSPYARGRITLVRRLPAGVKRYRFSYQQLVEGKKGGDMIIDRNDLIVIE